ncbi:hypothetical protein [Vibrio tarriae]|uniref:hypothetical protein n=1 Tax=Vibrio tarriae TaxID=2014742 RepID=UPI0011BFCF46|nr:hypothetical protein [Vibrio tarriae]
MKNPRFILIIAITLVALVSAVLFISSMDAPSTTKVLLMYAAFCFSLYPLWLSASQERSQFGGTWEDAE